MELAEGGGLSSYPHPYLMPDFWQFPTVSMGLGPLMSIYQARFMRYLKARGLLKRKRSRASGPLSATAKRTSRKRSVRSPWRRGRTGQPDLGRQLQFAAPGRPGARQRQDHPGIGRRFSRRGLERDQGHLGLGMGRACWRRHFRPAGQAHGGGRRWRFPKIHRRTGSYIRRHFFGKYPELLQLVNHLTDDDLDPFGARRP
jgi:pyruvate dehydrogenase E1 component